MILDDGWGERGDLRAVVLEGENDWVLGCDECRLFDGGDDVSEADV